jgi:hypothetical protein
MTSVDSSRVVSAFDGLVEHMQSIELPHIDIFPGTETVLPVLKTLLQQYGDQHSRTKKDIASLRSAWTCLASVGAYTPSQAVLDSSGSDLFPTASSLPDAAPDAVTDVASGYSELENSRQLVHQLQQQLQDLTTQYETRNEDVCTENEKLRLRISELEAQLNPSSSYPQITEEAILAFPTNLPAFDDASALPADADSYAKLAQSYSAAASQAKTLIRSMNQIRNLARDFLMSQTTSPPNSVRETPSALAGTFSLNQANSSNPQSSHPANPPNSVPELSPSILTPAVQSSGTMARYLAVFQKLSDAAIAGLKRKDKRSMDEVFCRHAKPLGLSAKALVSALHVINPSAFPAQVSDADAAKRLKEVDAENKGHANFEEFCQAAKIPFNQGAVTSPARDVFLRFVQGLSAEALIDALKEVGAPILLSSEGCTPEQIFRRADVNMSGSVDFAESDSPSLVLNIFRCHVD